MGSRSSHAVCQRRQSWEQSAELTASGASSPSSGEEFVPRAVVWEWGARPGPGPAQPHPQGGPHRLGAPMSLTSGASSSPLRAGGDIFGVRRGFSWGRTNHAAPEGVCSPANLVTAPPPPHPTQDPPPPPSVLLGCK